MKNNYFVLSLVLALFIFKGFGQDLSNDNAPNLIIKATEFKIVPPLNKQIHIPPDTTPRVGSNDRWVNFPTNFNALPKGKDPLLSEDLKATKLAGKAPIVNIDGATSGVHSGATPPDPTGAVGPNHYIHAYNSGFVIYDKSGTILQAHSSLAMLWPGETLGDPIVLYDRYADRFVVTQFTGNTSLNTGGLLIAVCQGPDPVNDGWYTYYFDTVTFPDYPHYSIWHDGYYVTVNKNPGFGVEQVFALERDKLILGDPAAQMIGFIVPNVTENTVFSSMAMNSVGPNLPDASLPEYVVYLQDDAWAGGVDRLKIWEVDVDWITPANSTISLPDELSTTPFDSFVAPFGSGEVPQPGTGQRIDGITGLMSYSVNYYNYGGTNSATMNFNVDVNGDNTVLGIRWFELRETAGTWSIYQEGTFAPDDGLYRFMGSMCLDANGNIGLAYSVANSSTFPSLRYTGRYSNTPLGQMALQEQTIVDGIGSMTYANRWGDYSHLTLDPTDNETFWFASEYMNITDQWRTRIASFIIAPTAADDVGVVSIDTPTDGALSGSETITVTLFNFGTDPQTNIPVSYQVDGGTIVNETYTGTLASTSSDTYVFTTTANLNTEGQTYSIIASTNLAGDADSSNDDETVDVRYLPANDLGVVSINTPSTGVGLTATEVIDITVQNFGSSPQSNFDVSYSINGSPVTEQIVGPLNSGASQNFGFATTGDFSANGLYQVAATTSLGGDFDTGNDGVSKSVFNASCIPTSTSCNIDGIKRFVLGTIDADDGGSGCNSTGPNGYSDRTSLSTDLDRSSGNNTHLLQAQHNWTGGATIEQLSVWIDFNDNGVFEGSEQLIIAENYTVAGTLDDFDLVIPTDAALGTHILRARGLDPTGFPGDPNNPCENMQYGETQDYTVNITDSTLSIDDFALNGSEFVVYDRGDNQFEVLLKPVGFSDDLVITMHNALGQKLVKNRVFYENGQYRYMLNLNGLSAGVYLIRLGTNNYGRVKRIIVK